MGSGNSDDKVPFRVGTVNWSGWKGSTVVVTGSTGLIGCGLVSRLVAADKSYGLGLRLLLPVRDMERARKMLPCSSSSVQFFQWRLGEALPLDEPADMLIHAAANTSSFAFLNKPVEVAVETVAGAEAVLSYARRNESCTVVMLSTMEVYGAVSGNVDETTLGQVDTMLPRSSYPESKRFMENLCAAYHAQYGTKVVVARLGQCFGGGVRRDDGRVFAEFARAAISGEDIVLLTDGSSRATYVSVNDAVSALIVLADQGSPGQAYNVVNESTYCSVLEMAELVKRHFGSDSCRIVFDRSGVATARFRQHSDLRLSSVKLRSLGWVPNEGLVEMYESMINTWCSKAEH